ncbi:LOW QUALITY PROTEIN: hypothetical protein PHMEG_00026294 [Phytophthora megakarya]|uniref:Uncharacterized protein n=1 Tax=Phytophthora megakarya TaxID=4795 RepID=A0A225VBN1_9STRA|nr:LOW QUALITY PROTEIN: hypothetical protein PHMEG_00026294 [Phytophthora megakarya]
MHDANQDLRTENEKLVARIRELDITIAEQAHGVQRRKDRCRSPDADCAAAIRYVAQERGAGLAGYNAELTKLRPYLEKHDRGKVFSASPRMKALLAENSSLCRANSVLRQNSAEHGLNTDALILSTAGLSASGLDWGLLGLSPIIPAVCDFCHRVRNLKTRSDSAPPVIEVSPGSGSLDEESAEHSFIRPSSDSSVEPSTEVSVSGSDSGGLFDEKPDEDPPRKRKRLRQNAVRKAASAAIPSAIHSGPKKTRPSTPVSTGGPSLGNNSHSPPHPILEEGEIADDAGFDSGSEVPIGDASARPSPLSDVHVAVTSGQSQSSASKSAKDSSLFSSPVVSYFRRQDGRPRRSTSVISELKMRESFERELADDDFMLSLTSEGSAAATSVPSRDSAQDTATPADAAEFTTKKSVVTESSTADPSMEAQVPPETSSAVDSSVKAQFFRGDS